jgi:hypothetical protein
MNDKLKDESKEIMRRDMISAFASFLNQYRDETVIGSHLDLLSAEEREWFDMCIKDIIRNSRLCLGAQL